MDCKKKEHIKRGTMNKQTGGSACLFFFRMVLLAGCRICGTTLLLRVVDIPPGQEFVIRDCNNPAQDHVQPSYIRSVGL